LNAATSLISQTSPQTTYHECSPYAERTAFVSNGWIDIENVNSVVQHYKKKAMLLILNLLLQC